MGQWVLFAATFIVLIGHLDELTEKHGFVKAGVYVILSIEVFILVLHKGTTTDTPTGRVIVDLAMVVVTCSVISIPLWYSGKFGGWLERAEKKLTAFLIRQRERFPRLCGRTSFVVLTVAVVAWEMMKLLIEFAAPSLLGHH